MQFLGKSSKEKESASTSNSIDGVSDPGILTNQLSNTNKSFRYRPFKHVAISEMATFCPRQYVIGYLEDEKREEFVEFPGQIQMDIGSAFHFWLQNYSKIYKHNLYGYWRCAACHNYRLNEDGSLYFGKRPSYYLKRGCEHCGASSDASFFEEFFFRLNDPYPVSGKMDGVLEKENVFRFIDFKTYWDGKDLPLGKDKVQLATYMLIYSMLPNESKFPVEVDTNIGYLIYFSKKFNYRNPILTYPVYLTESFTNTTKAQLELVKRGQQFGEVPEPFESCKKSGFQAGRAKNCAMKEKCREYYYNS